MYQKNDIEVDYFTGIDAKEDSYNEEGYKYKDKKVIALPHSCDDWIIGGKEEAEQMIKDLREAIGKL